MNRTKERQAVRNDIDDELQDLQEILKEPTRHLVYNRQTREFQADLADAEREQELAEAYFDWRWGKDCDREEREFLAQHRRYLDECEILGLFDDYDYMY